MFRMLFALCLLGAGLAHAEVYYEIFVRSFQDSDADGIGDLQGARARLDYLDALGVAGVWLMPIHPSPTYHGYDVTDYGAINPDYGTLEDFDQFVEAAHERGIKVVMDLVVNHSSDQHAWFVAAQDGDERYRDFYLWSDTDPGWRGTSGAPAWHESESGYYLGLFWSGMPDLNLRNPEVTRELEAVARFWLEHGVDGFRIDAVQHLIESRDGNIRNTPETVAWVAEFEAFVKSVNPGAFLVGETWTDAQTITTYFEEGKLDVAFDYPLYDALLASVQSRSAGELELALEQAARFFGADDERATFISNHDNLRPATSFGLLRREVGRLKLAAGLLLTLPGTPYLYYGEEIGLPNGPGDKDEEKRTPMRWDPDLPYAGFSSAEPWYAFSTDDPEISVAAQESDPDSLFTWYRKLIALRAATPALERGETELLASDERALLVFRRERDAQQVLVLANLGTDDLELDLSVWTQRAASDLVTGERVGPALRLTGLELRVLELAD